MQASHKLLRKNCMHCLQTEALEKQLCVSVLQSKSRSNALPSERLAHEQVLEPSLVWKHLLCNLLAVTADVCILLML